MNYFDLVNLMCFLALKHLCIQIKKLQCNLVVNYSLVEGRKFCIFLDIFKSYFDPNLTLLAEDHWLLQEIILFLHYYPRYTHTHTFVCQELSRLYISQKAMAKKKKQKRKRKRQEKLLENLCPNITVWKSLKPFFCENSCFRAFELL